jgi:hypothetical protein
MAFKIPKKITAPIPSHMKYSLGWATSPPMFGTKTCMRKRKITESVINK